MIDADLSMREFEAIAKASYVEAASSLAVRGRGSVNQSAVSAITGLSRSEVKALINQPAGESHRDNRSRARRVVDGWTTDRRFSRLGQPRVLPVKGRGTTFETLVRSYGADTPPRAILDRLRSLHVVRVIPKSLDAPARVALLRPSSRRLVDPVLQEIASHLSRALARSKSTSKPTLRATKLLVRDPRAIAVIERIIAERAEVFLSSVRSLADPSRGAHAQIDVFVGTSSSERTRERMKSGSNLKKSAVP